MIRLQKLLPLALALVLPLAAGAQNISTVAGGGITGVPALDPNTSIGGPDAVVKDALGNTYILDNYFSRVFKVDHTTGNLTLIAGNGTAGYSGDNGPAAKAVLNQPTDMFMDSKGDLYIADAENGAIRKITNLATTPTISTVAGTGALGYSGDGGPATSAQMYFPDGVWVDSNQNIFIADKANHIVREVAGKTATNFGILMTAGNIYTIAGTPPTAGPVYHNGYRSTDEGKAATSALLNNPWGVSGDSFGNIFITDSTNNIVRKIAVVTDIITTVAGTPPPALAGFSGDGGLATKAQLNTPHGILVDGSGNLFISDYENHTVRKVAAGNIATIAGTGVRGPSGDGGLATSAKLDHASNVFIDGSGNVFIADRDSGAIRDVAGTLAPPSGQAAGNIYTVDGNGHPFFGGDGGSATNAELGLPSGVAVDAGNNIFIADPTNHTIRKAVPGGNIQTVAGVGGSDGYGAEGEPATAARLEAPNSVFVDPSGNIFIADTRNHIIREVVAGNIQTVAGSVPTGTPLVAHPGYNGDGLSATVAQLNTPYGVFVDSNGNIFIADTMNHVIREVPAKDIMSFGIAMKGGNMYNVAGTPTTAGYRLSDEAALATTAELNQPQGIFVDGFGDLFIADTANHIIREVPALNGNGMTVGHIYTVAGTPTTSGFSGDGGPATSATLNNPSSVSVDAAGNIFVADAGNCLIREVAAGKISSVAGTVPNPTTNPPSCGFSGDGGLATRAKLNAAPITIPAPIGIALGPSPSNNLLIADSNNVRVRSVAGLGSNPGLSLSASTLTFPDQIQGFASAPQPVVLINTGSASLTINLAISGDFTETDNCASLAPGKQCTINVTFKPTGTGLRTGSITLTDGAGNSPQTIKLSGNGVEPTADLSPASLAFGDQPVGSPSTAQVITLTNNGNAALTITGIAVMGTNGGDFTLSPAGTCPTTFPATLAMKTSCTISVTFRPTATLGRSASLTITDNTIAGTQTVPLSGTGIASAVTLSSLNVTFGAQLVGTTSAAQTVTLTNSGTAQLNIASIAASGDFAKANTSTCVAGPLAVNAKCTIDVTFTPTLTGTRNGTLTITDDATPGTQTVSLTGTGGTPTATLSGAVLTFNAQLVGTPSTAQTVTLTNNGNIALGITSIAVGGTNSADFAQTNTCGTSVAVSANCTISVKFTPGANGSRTASITITDNATGSPQSITLTGTGVAAPVASLSSTSVSFTTQLVGVSSAAQTVTLTNSGASALNIASIAVGGANAGDFAQTNTCGTSVAAGANCTISVTFTPSSSGTRAASITITDNAAGSPHSVSLSGMGMAISLGLATNGSNTQTVKAGQTATYNLQLSATGGTATDQASVTISCTGAPALSTCNAPAAAVVVTPAAPAPVSITVNTTAGTMLVPVTPSEPKMQLPTAMPTLLLALVAILLSIAAFLTWMQSPAGRLRTLRIAFSACLVLLPVSAATLLGGCASGGGSIPPVHTVGTAAGTYTLTVTATASGKAQSTQLALIVQ